MRFREKLDENWTVPDNPGGNTEGGELERLSQAGNDLLAAGDEAIRRALSGDSVKFLQANRQQGGE